VTISACLNVTDEEERLPAALASVAFCDEIVVVDGGSRDRTRQIARAAGARVVENPWPGFGAQRNVAIDHASGDWILEVDADERVQPALAAEIRAMTASAPGELDMGALPLRDVFLGRPLGPSTGYPLYRYRLFRRGAYRHDEGRTVHEGLWSRSPVHAFTADLEHILAGSLREALGDWWRYAALQAAQTPRPSSALAYARGLILRPAAKAAYRVLVMGGWRDGWRGLLKIALDCSSDVVVWSRVALGGGATAASDGGHFGGQRPMLGSVRIAAVAAGERDVAAAARWLREAAAHGADVALVADRPVAGLHVRRVERLGYAALARALDAEMQLRPLDAVVPWGGRARLLTRALTARQRGAHPPLSPSTAPAEAVAVVRRATRSDPYPAPSMPTRTPA
jgi:hypothetical protein